MRKLPFALLLLVLLAVKSPRAQGVSQLDTVLEHFEGIWVGVNHAYTKNPYQTSQITITVKRDKHEGRLDMVYAYLDAGKKKEEKIKRTFTFQPATSTVIIDRQDAGKRRFQVVGLKDFLNAGYGDFTLNDDADPNRVGRYEYHLSATQWTIVAYYGEDGDEPEKTGDWTLQRVSVSPVASDQNR